MYIKVKFLDGYYADSNKTADPRDWPPSPSRLFSALVNGYYLLTRSTPGANSAALRKTLEWLEQCPPPDIYCASKNKDFYVPNVFCPVNFFDGENSKGVANREVQGRNFPVVWPWHDSVYFSWDGDQPTEHQDALIKIARYVPVLGTAKSFAIFTVGCELPADVEALNRYTPRPDGNLSLSSYYEGRMKDLDACYAQNIPPIPGSDINYQRVFVGQGAPESRWSRTTMLRMTGPHILEIGHAASVAVAVRSAALRIASELNVRPPALIGHDAAIDHCAFLALPYLGGGFGSNKIMGVCVATPAGRPLAEQLEIGRVVSHLNQFRYKDADWELTPTEPQLAPHTLQETTWATPSDLWTSVTPAEVCWSPKATFEEREERMRDYLLVQCAQQKLPPVIDISVHSFSEKSGAPPARHFSLQALIVKRDGNRQRGFLTHCTVRFAEEIGGPLVLGRGRNFGLGLMSPVPRGWQADRGIPRELAHA